MNEDTEGPGATVCEIDGQLALDDPDALAIIREVGRRNCQHTFEINADRVEHFKKRFRERNLSVDEFLIVILNVDDVNGSQIAKVLMPGYNWQEIRDRGEIPFARGLVSRELI